jgi:hypothetical protein
MMAEDPLGDPGGNMSDDPLPAVQVVGGTRRLKKHRSIASFFPSQSTVREVCCLSSDSKCGSNISVFFFPMGSMVWRYEVWHQGRFVTSAQERASVVDIDLRLVGLS